MAKPKLRFNIFHKLLLTLLAVSLIPLLAFWLVGSMQVRKDISANIAHNLVATVSGIAAGINNWDDANVRVLRSASKIDDITSMERARQTPVLRAFGDTYEWAFVVYTMDHNGDNIARSDDKPLINFADRSYFKGAMKGEPISRQVLISKSTGKPALTVAVPIRNALGQPAGVIAMAMKLDDISKVIKDTKIGDTGYVLLIDADNKVIATGMKGQPSDAVQDMGSHPAFKVEGISDAPAIYRKDDGKRVIAYVHKLPQGWTLIVEQDYAEAYAPLERLELGARVLILVTGALVLMIASLLGKALTRPINQLINVAEQLSKGQFQDSIPETGRGDEIGALARAIDRLGVSIRMAMERLRKKA
ncbi:cache and HAMP domain-containing protein [Massilia sp. CF038]|uniref:HAMP domain-containing protein n=1 Tax=Massilia sp. CF038 TaxID=1881045 RepID=UPI0009228F17|nr:cache and HAMP domain-containing protein [Massilia sp. CF038]SHH05004.1 methyl-accepting chemotaxis protein [Massilia sp. CF038]